MSERLKLYLSKIQNCCEILLRIQPGEVGVRNNFHSLENLTRSVLQALTTLTFLLIH